MFVCVYFLPDLKYFSGFLLFMKCGGVCLEYVNSGAGGIRYCGVFLVIPS